MLLTPHTVVGAAVAAAVSNPVLAVPAAFLSHFAMDLVPHWDDVGLGKLEERYQRISPRSFRFILLDGLLSLSFVLVFLYWAMPDYGVGMKILAGALAANLPDIFYIPLAFFGKRWGWVMAVVRFQSRLQTKSKAPIVFGILTQLAAIASGWLLTQQEILVRLPQTWLVP